MTIATFLFEIAAILGMLLLTIGLSMLFWVLVQDVWEAFRPNRRLKRPEIADVHEADHNLEQVVADLEEEFRRSQIRLAQLAEEYRKQS